MAIERPSDSGKKNVSFDYNAFGNRIAKHVFDDNWNLEKSTYYIVDAQGNQLSMYEHTVDSNQVNFTLAERNIYGASRLGRTNLAVNMYSSTQEAPISEVLGHRSYELSNHLGNVLTVINDIKIPLSDDNETVSGYDAGIVSISDYSPGQPPILSQKTPTNFRILLKIRWLFFCWVEWVKNSGVTNLEPVILLVG